MNVVSSRDIPRFHCVITDANGNVIYSGRTTAPGEPFIGGIGETITVHPDDYNRIAADCAKADLARG